MPSNTSALPLGNHLGAEAINAGNEFLSGVAAEPARHVTDAERRQGGGHDGGGGTRAAVGGRTPLETDLHGRQEALGWVGSPPLRHRPRTPFDSPGRKTWHLTPAAMQHRGA